MVIVVAAARVVAVWNDPLTPRAGLIEKTLFRLFLSGVAAFIVFRLFQPYAFETPSTTGIGLAQRWIDNALEARSWVSGERDAPFGHQWASRTPLVFPLTNMLTWGMGLPLGLTAWAGFGLAAWQLFRHARWAHLVPVVWTALLFGVQGTQWVMSMRYFLPIYPTLAILAGWLLIYAWDRAQERPTRGRLSWTPRAAGAAGSGGDRRHAAVRGGIHQHLHAAALSRRGLALDVRERAARGRPSPTRRSGTTVCRCAWTARTASLRAAIAG